MLVHRWIWTTFKREKICKIREDAGLYIDLTKKLWKSAIYNSMKLLFDVEFAEKFSNGIVNNYLWRWLGMEVHPPSFSSFVAKSVVTKDF